MGVYGAVGGGGGGGGWGLSLFFGIVNLKIRPTNCLMNINGNRFLNER